MLILTNGSESTFWSLNMHLQGSKLNVETCVETNSVSPRTSCLWPFPCFPVLTVRYSHTRKRNASFFLKTKKKRKEEPKLAAAKFAQRRCPGFRKSFVLHLFFVVVVVVEGPTFQKRILASGWISRRVRQRRRPARAGPPPPPPASRWRRCWW